MPRRILALTIVFMLMLSCGLFISAETTIPATLDKPQDLTVRTEGESEFEIRWTNPANILQLIDATATEGHSLLYVIDWKKNDGSWNIGDITPNSPQYNDEIHGYFFGHMESVMYDENSVSESFLVTWHLDPDVIDENSTFDLVNDTYYFRMRYALMFFDDDEKKPIVSPYTEPVAIGKNANTTAVTELEAPKDLKVTVKKDSNDKPYFQLDWTIPESIFEANKQLPVSHVIDFKVGDGKWHSETTSWDLMPGAPSGLLKSSGTFDPVEKEYVEDIIIEENTYYFRVLFKCEPDGREPVRSSFSNIASTKMEAYSNASPWAKPELDKAAEFDLIPDSLKGADMTKPITREEFAELAVRLYEKTTGEIAQAASPNPFTDTKNPEVLKALNLGVTTGMSLTTFTPAKFMDREQVATMLSRAIRKMAPEGTDFSTTGAPVFTDQKDISSWALEHVLYMSKIGIIKGDNGKFMPRAITSAQIAEGYATTTREQAISMTVRTYEK